MSERVSDAVLELFCDEAWLDDRPQSHSVLLIARELKDCRRALLAAEAECEQLRAERDASVQRMKAMGASLKAEVAAYRAALARREHPTAEPDE